MLAVAAHRLERIELGLAHATVLVAVDAVERGTGALDALRIGRCLALTAFGTCTLLEFLLALLGTRTALDDELVAAQCTVLVAVGTGEELGALLAHA